MGGDVTLTSEAGKERLVVSPAGGVTCIGRRDSAADSIRSQVTGRAAPIVLVVDDDPNAWSAA